MVQHKVMVQRNQPQFLRSQLTPASLNRFIPLSQSFCRSKMPRVRNRNFDNKRLPIFDYEILRSFLEGNKVSVKHVQTIWQYLLSTPFANLYNLDKIPNLPKSIIKPIQSKFCLFTTKVVQAKTSIDNTTKLLVELYDGLQIETVIIRQGASTVRRPDGETQTTICVSSQVGCKMGVSKCNALWSVSI